MITAKRMTNWNYQPPRPKDVAYRKRVTRIVWHYTYTPEGEYLSPTTIDQWHRNNGWNGIGYHFIIEPDGSYYHGRPVNVVGAHAKNANTDSIGIVCVGGKRGNDPKGYDTRTAAQKKTLYEITNALRDGFFNTDNFTVNEDAEVLGHFQVPGNATQCPGFDARAEWLNYKKGAGQYDIPAIPAAPPSPTAPPKTAVEPEKPPTKLPIPEAAIVPTAAVAAAAPMYLAWGWWGVGIVAVVLIVYFVIRRNRR